MLLYRWLFCPREMWNQAENKVLLEQKRQHVLVLIPNVFLAIACVTFTCLYWIRFNSAVNMQKVTRNESPYYSDEINYYDARCSTLVLKDMKPYLTTQNRDAGVAAFKQSQLWADPEAAYD